MKKAEEYFHAAELGVVALIIAYCLGHTVRITMLWNRADGVDWTSRLLVTPGLYFGIVYGAFRVVFIHGLEKTKKVICSPLFIIVISLFACYILVLIYTRWAISFWGPGFEACQGTLVYDILLTATRVATSPLQEGISTVFGILLAFGITGIQYAE